MDAPRIRGLLPEDSQAFSPVMRERLRQAQQELQFLLQRGYPTKSAATFVGNHHQLSLRQLLALTRTTASGDTLALREEKRLAPLDMRNKPIHIDGFNLIITLEVALSDGMLFIAQDGCIRDLAELRGSYRIIPQTKTAIALLRDAVRDLNCSEVVILLDRPVSNAGRLKTALYEEEWPIPLTVELVQNPDTELKRLGHVASGDSIILDDCESWFNLTAWILETQGIFPRLSRCVHLD